MRLVRWYPLQDWVPPVDIVERNDQFVIRAELPGLQRDEMEIQIENGVLTLRGERKRETGETEGDAFRTERIYGTFTRSFSLGTEVDAAKVSAAYKDGVLTVIVPKVCGMAPAARTAASARCASTSRPALHGVIVL